MLLNFPSFDYPKKRIQGKKETIEINELWRTKGGNAFVASLSLSLSFSTRLFGRQVGFHDPLEIYAFKEEGQVSKVPANIQWDQLLSAQRHDSPRTSV